MSDHEQQTPNDQPVVPPTAPEAPAPPPPVVNQGTAPSSMTAANWPTQRIVAIGGAALIIVGSLMPWVTLSTAFGTISRSGTDGGGDGIITLIGGVIIGILVLTKKYLASVIVSAITAAILVFDFFDISSSSDIDGDFGSVSVGWGLIVATLAGIAALVGSALMMQIQRAEKKPTHT